MTQISVEYIAAGGNRHPSAADWSSSLLAFGAGNNIALWNPEDHNRRGVHELLAGHVDTVNAIKIIDAPDTRLLVSGSADKTVRIWAPSSDSETAFKQSQCLTDHTASVNAIAAAPQLGLIASGAADGTVIIWHLEGARAKLIQTISLKPRYFPLCFALTASESGGAILAVAGTSNYIQLFGQTQPESEQFELQATLTGHEGWVRSLDFTHEHHDRDSDILLASASQDKYVRLWRLRQGKSAADSTVSEANKLFTAAEKTSLSNKAHRVGRESSKHTVTFEALLVGHEDWIYTARWAPRAEAGQVPSLLTASADNSLSIWNAEPASGLWICSSRVGEVSSQKGSTTATGSTGGFWIGLWQSDSQAVVSLGRTGSWRKWAFDPQSDMWVQEVGVGGHVEEVRSLAWARSGRYLLSTGSDQTTRLYSQWRKSGKESVTWHEFTRPQIHGYDLNCIDTINDNRFISGADEKLLRVFDKPKAVNDLLAKLGSTDASSASDLPDAAAIPVLGLSNKAVNTLDEDEPGEGTDDPRTDEHDFDDSAPKAKKATLDLEHPPFEDHLARHTLWPEHEKLYGHGYEISAVAASNDGTIVATSCKASSLDHAVVRLYDTKEWREVKPALTAHSLTVTSLKFSPDDSYLLSVGRDRQWALFHADETSVFTLLTTNPKGHSRMILDCCWAPLAAGHVFATAGRDKTVKIWKLSGGKVECVSTHATTAPPTAICFNGQPFEQHLLLAVGDETGKITIVRLEPESLAIVALEDVTARCTPSKAVTSLRWRPTLTTDNTLPDHHPNLAASSEDCSVRIYRFKERASVAEQ
ncbi:Putative elongator complex protein [Septoria linicola]|uniref:Elongator complex protein 2 n=1 Tax=Septoria linicola TaxID=215465 RepID=A0A9Q9AKQ0_9PEZI|nr:putative elongator complex protein [Septoria linicola]USW49719.1 Putative elongator complex protein [Septoria linicola]